MYCNVGNLGGAGNPGTDGASDGTGGLLIIACENLINNNGIEAKGAYGSGGSGGGSINIFYTGSCEYGENSYISAAGGSGSGRGGTGSITIGSIATEIYRNTYSNYSWEGPYSTVTYQIDTEVSETKDILKGENVLTYAPTATKTGYTFVGWREDTSALNDVLSTRTANENNITLNAVFEKVSKTVTFNGNGEDSGNIDPIIIKEYYNNGNTEENNVITLPKSRFIKNGYFLVGYSTTQNETQQDNILTPDSQYTVESDTILYAQWSDKLEFEWGPDAYRSGAWNNSVTHIFSWTNNSVSDVNITVSMTGSQTKPAYCHAYIVLDSSIMFDSGGQRFDNISRTFDVPSGSTVYIRAQAWTQGSGNMVINN